MYPSVLDILGLRCGFLRTFMDTTLGAQSPGIFHLRIPVDLEPKDQLHLGRRSPQFHPLPLVEWQHVFFPYKLTSKILCNRSITAMWAQQDSDRFCNRFISAIQAPTNDQSMITPRRRNSSTDVSTVIQTAVPWSHGDLKEDVETDGNNLVKNNPGSWRRMSQKGFTCSNDFCIQEVHWTVQHN